MNKIDKSMYKALRFFSKLTEKEAFTMKYENSKKYRKYVSSSIEDALHKVGRIGSNDRENESALTDSGLEQLRILGDIKLKEKSILISIFALAISILALAKSFGWI